MILLISIIFVKIWTVFDSVFAKYTKYGNQIQIQIRDFRLIQIQILLYLYLKMRIQIRIWPQVWKWLSNSSFLKSNFGFIIQCTLFSNFFWKIQSKYAFRLPFQYYIQQSICKYLQHISKQMYQLKPKYCTPNVLDISPQSDVGAPSVAQWSL